MATTLEIQEKLNKLLEEAEKIAQSLSSHYKDQVDLLEKLADSSKKIVEALEGQKNCDMAKCFEDTAKAAENAKKSVSDAMTEAANKTKTATDTSKQFDESIKKTTQSVKEMESGISIIEGIGKALSFVGGMASSFLSVAFSIGSALFSFAKAVIGFPFAVLQGLIDMSAQGGSSELAQALQDIRKEFGYLDRTAGRSVVQLAKNMKGELANTGLRVYRTFGNLAERLKYFTEYAKNLGETVDAVFNTLKASSAEALGAYNKALGFTAAGQKGVAQRALATGQDINEINRQVANFSLQLSSAFGVTMKLVSRDVGEMMADFEHFGNLSVQELTQAAVYARKLGIEVKSLGKLVDKFLNFEDAANSAAQLSQAFGLNVDAFKLMSEQDPAKKMQMLRDSFFAAGKTIENMNAQERRLLATQTGLSESELALAFSQKSRGVSYDEIKKKGDAAQKSQLTQEQVLQKLSGAIERLVKSGEALKGGFFDVFLQGFVKGIRITTEFRQLMRALRQSINIVFRAGIQVGRMFMHIFPGVQDFFVGLRRVFDPSAMRNLMNQVKAAFGDFFQAMTKNPSTALPILLDKLREAFLGRLSAAGPGGRQVLEGIKSFFKAIVAIAASLLRLVLPEITKLFKFITDLITGRASLNVQVPSDGGFLRQALDPLITTIVELGPPLWDAFTGMLKVVFDKAVDFIKSKLPEIGDVIKYAILFVAAGTAIPMVLKGIFSGIVALFSKFVGVTAAAAPAAGASTMGESIAKFFEGIGKVKPGEVAKAGGIMIAMAAAFAIGGVAMAYGVKKMVAVLEDTPLTKVISALSILTAVALNALMLVGALKLISTVGDTASLIAGGEIMMKAIAGLVLATYIIIQAFKDVPENQMLAISKSMLVMTGVLLGAGLLVGEAMLIGLLVSGPQAAAVGAGLLAIGAVIVAMTVAIKKMMQEINSLSLNAGFKDKVDAFVSIFKAVSEFIGQLAPVIDSLKPGLFETILGNSTLEKNLMQMTNFVRGLIGQPGGGGIIGLIQTITTTLSSLTPESVKNAQSFAEVLKAVASLMKAMQVETSILAHLSASDIQLVISRMTVYLLESRIAITALITQVENFIRSITTMNISAGQRDSILAVTGVIQTLGTFLQAIVPSPEVVRVLQRPAGSVQQGLDPVKLADYQRFIGQLYTAIGPLITKMSEFVGAIGRLNFGNITPSALEMVKGVAAIFTSFASMMTSFTNTMGEAIRGKNKTDAAALMNNMRQYIQEFITKITRDLPTLITNITNGFRNLNIDRTVAATIDLKVRALSAMFSVLNKISEVLNSFSGGQSMHGGQLWDKMKMFADAMDWLLDPGNKVGNSVRVFLDRLKDLVVPKGTIAKAGQLKTIFDTIKSVSEAVNVVGQGTANFETAKVNLTGMNTFIGSNELRTIITTLSANTLAASNTGMANTARAITDMVSTVNSISADLASINSVNLTTNLRNLGTNLGLGATSSYTIENRNFTVTVNVDVKVDAAELETALLRKGTRISHT